MREFTEASRIMKSDPEVRTIIGNAARTPVKTRKVYLRILMAAVLVLVVAVPIYKYAIVDDSGKINQTLEFRATRSGGADVIYLDRGGAAEIKFQINESLTGDANILLTRFEGDTVRHIMDYSDFTEEGFGSLVLPLADLHDGHYILKIIPTADSAREIQYMFRVK